MRRKNRDFIRDRKPKRRINSIREAGPRRNRDIIRDTPSSCLRVRSDVLSRNTNIRRTYRDKPLRCNGVAGGAHKRRHCDWRLALRLACVSVAITIPLLYLSGVQQRRRDAKECLNMRTKAFANYITDSIYTDARNGNQPEYNISKNNPKALQMRLSKLQTDSARYVKAISRDAVLIHKIDSACGYTAAFAEAMDSIRVAPRDVYVNRVITSDDDPNQTEEIMVYMGVSQSAKLLINCNNLKTVCQNLLAVRNAIEQSR